MAILSNYDIKQITGYDIQDYPVILHTIKIPHRKDTPNEDGKYEIEFIDAEIPYVLALSNQRIIKFGYCCEDKGIIYPIFIKNKGKEDFDQINISKNYIYEAQTENINENIYNIIITDIEVPLNINFTLDYVVEKFY